MVAPVSRLRTIRIALAVTVVGCVLAGTVAAVSHDPVTLGPGRVTEAADSSTLVSVQGFHFQGRGNRQKPARLAAAGPRGQVQWVYESRPQTQWFYDIEPRPDGSVLVTATNRNGTAVFEYDPDTRSRDWTEQFPIKDTHDVDLLDGGRLLVANMREYEDGVSGDRLFVYDRTTDEITWEWVVHEHYPNDTDGGFDRDWTHLNDVDPVGEEAVLASLRNFDQVVLIDRETKAIEARLGRDGERRTLDEQHNPDLLSRDPLTILVADSENGRVVEYARVDGEWRRTWTLTGLHWPRDADRLPNGNTLVTETLAHRVIEVTPEGEVVWEFYAPWAPYDAERRATGDGSRGPTMRELNATGTVTANGTGGDGPSGAFTPADLVASLGRGTPVESVTKRAARTWAHVTPWVRPVWLSRWAFAAFSAGATVAVVWAGAEILVRRRAVIRGIGSAWGRVRDRTRTRTDRSER